jgi:hypothetical protein
MVKEVAIGRVSAGSNRIFADHAGRDGALQHGRLRLA